MPDDDLSDKIVYPSPLNISKRYILEEDVRDAVLKVLEKIKKIDFKTASGKNRLPVAVLVEAEQIIKSEFGSQLSESMEDKR